METSYTCFVCPYILFSQKQGRKRAAVAQHEAAFVSGERQVVLGRGWHLCHFLAWGTHVEFFPLTCSVPRGAVCIVALGTGEVRQHLVPFFGLFAGAAPTRRSGRVLQRQNSRPSVRNPIQLDGRHEVRRDFRGATKPSHLDIALTCGGQEAVGGGGNAGSGRVRGVRGYRMHLVMSVSVHVRGTRLLSLVWVVDIQTNGIFKVGRSLGHSGGPGLCGRTIRHRVEKSGTRRSTGLHAHHCDRLVQILNDTRSVLVRLEFSEGSERDISSASLNNRILLI